MMAEKKDEKKPFDVKTKRQELLQELDRAGREVDAWTKRVSMIQGALAILNEIEPVAVPVPMNRAERRAAKKGSKSA